MTETETPTEEWLTNARGRQYAVIRGPGGGTVFRKGEESVDEARARRAIETEAKRRKQSEPPKAERPKGKGRRPDPKPGPSSRPEPGKPKPSRDQLAAAAELPLQVLGAFVGYQVLACDFCAASMRANAGPAARDLAKTTNPYLLSMLTWWFQLVHAFAGGDGLARYLGPPLVHHALPEAAASFVSPFMGVPPRPPKARAHRHDAPPARAETRGPVPGEGSPQPPPDSPPGGGEGAPQAMTPEQAAAMAGAPPTPEQMRAMEAEAQALRSEAVRLAAARDLGMRQAAAAAQQPRGPNIPAYRADQAPVQGPPANGAAPGTPQAPITPDQVEGAAGSPLPPEAMM